MARNIHTTFSARWHCVINGKELPEVEQSKEQLKSPGLDKSALWGGPRNSPAGRMTFLFLVLPQLQCRPSQVYTMESAAGKCSMGKCTCWQRLHDQTQACASHSTVCSINIARCITRRLWVWDFETKLSCFFLCLFSQLSWWNTNGRVRSSKATFQVRRLDMGTEARWPSFLPGCQSPTSQSLVSPSTFHTDSQDAERCRSHPIFNTAFNFGVFIDMTRCTSMTLCLRMSSVWYLIPITSYFCDRD